MAARTAAGTTTGVAIWVLAAAFGLSALLQASRIGYDVLRVIGAAYLVWLGVGSLRSRGRIALAEPDGQRSPVTGRVGYLTGVASNLANPKTGLFFITFFPALIPRGSPVEATSFLFGALFVLETAAWFAALLWMVERADRWLRRHAVQRALERLSGVVLIGFAIRLLTGGR